jgi:2-polyprenyl-3-methyl-5-hydroxy-6-metoxy-1,4-benzoquinol methylase
MSRPGGSREGKVRVDSGIRTEEVVDCLLCNAPGTSLYSGLSDHLFGAPGQWGFLQCTTCGLAWLNPRPIAADLSKVYRTYYTHVRNQRGNGTANILALMRRKSKGGLYAFVSGCSELADSWAWRQLGRPLSWVPLLRERALMGMMCLKAADRGKLLDLGCGDGRFLVLMRDAGWEVEGIEPDPEAAKAAERELGTSVTVGNLEDAGFPDESFDAVTLSHVIEHVYDPVALLAECRRVLKPSGSVVIVTPNIRSLGHQKFRSFWRGLEPPRHFHVFSSGALRVCCERAGLRVHTLRTSARSAGFIWKESETIRRHEEPSRLDRGLRTRFREMFFNLHEDGLCRTSEEAGEEILLMAGAEHQSFRPKETTAMPDALPSR